MVEELVGADGLVSDGDWVESKDQDPNGEIRLIQLADIGDGAFLNRSSRFLTPASATKLRCTFLRAGDVLVARMPDPLGRACIFPDIGQESVTAVDVLIWRSGNGIEPRWFMHFINSPQSRHRIVSKATGTTRQRISGGRLKKLAIPVPPLNEQRRIAANIDELFGEIEAGEQELEKVREGLAAYRRAMLKAAVTGELTHDWRETNEPNETGEELLAEIVERRKHEDDNWRNNGDLSERDRVPFNLPQGWAIAAISQLGHVGTGGTPKRGTRRYYEGATIPWVTSGLVNRGKIVNAEEFITEIAVRETNAKIHPAGSIVIAMYGEGKTRGRAARLMIDAATNQALAVLHTSYLATITVEYVMYFLEWFYERLRAKAAGGVQPNLNLGIVKQQLIPLPPLKEQEIIVERLNEAFVTAEALASEASVALTDAQRLRQSVLVAAFAGQLVPQDSADEPASVLLEQLHAEREAVSSGGGKGRADTSLRTRRRKTNGIEATP